jgi:hypothetical protein
MITIYKKIIMILKNKTYFEIDTTKFKIEFKVLTTSPLFSIIISDEINKRSITIFDGQYFRNFEYELRKLLELPDRLEFYDKIDTLYEEAILENI